MKFIIQNSETEFILNVYVKTNSKRQAIINPNEYNDFITILLRSKPVQNKANRELITLLKTKLKIRSSQINIISGLKDPNKRIRLIFEKVNSKQKIIETLIH
ncbi:MAG: DUF167 domain-containing protein [Candidatus Hodarchaeota archaeon]